MNPFKFKLTVAAAVLATCAATSIAYASDTSVSLPVTGFQYFDAGVGPLKISPAYGNPQKGAHSTFVKLPAGFVSPLHTHSGDYYGVVISGVVANAPTAEEADIALAPGSYWFQKGKENHVTKCLSANECVVFITQPSKFDYIPADSAAAGKDHKKAHGDAQ